MTIKSALLSFSLIAAPLSLTASVTSAEPYNPSMRSLQKMSRRGEPTVSMRALAAVCPTVKKVTGNEFLWKSEISKHIATRDPRAAGPSFLCNRLCPTKWPMKFYYSDGVKAGSVGYYGIYRGTGKSRAYCAAGGAPRCSIRQISANSKKAGRDGKLYLKLSNSVCYQVNPVGRTGRP